MQFGLNVLQPPIMESVVQWAEAQYRDALLSPQNLLFGNLVDFPVLHPISQVASRVH